MSKKNTQKHTSLFDLISSAFYDLFHHKSEKRLIDYKHLHLINHDELFGLVDWKQLNFIHWNKMRFFFEYVGAFSIFVFILSGFGFLVFSNSSPNTDYLTYNLDKVSVINHYSRMSDYNFYENSVASRSQNTTSRSKNTKLSYDITQDVDYLNDLRSYRRNIGVNRVANDTAYNSYSIQNDIDYINDVIAYENSVSNKKSKSLASNDGFIGLVVVEKDKNEVEEYLETVKRVGEKRNKQLAHNENTSAVLGKSVVRDVKDVFSNDVMAQNEIENTSDTCSFRVGSQLLSSGSKLSLEDLREGNYTICASFNGNSSYNDWSILNIEKGSTPLLRSFSGTECYELSDYKSEFNPGDKLLIESFKSDSSNVGSCLLEISK